MPTTAASGGDPRCDNCPQSAMAKSKRDPDGLASLDPPDLATLPWYGADRTLPASRFIPGLTPPRQSHQPAIAHGPWTAQQWPTLQPYLRGVDLFNRWYFWEAHEEWERLWRAHQPPSEPARYIQGLIAAAAALLKLRMGQVQAARTLSMAACHRLAAFRGRWMGLKVSRFCADLARCLASAGQKSSPIPAIQTPRIRLENPHRPGPRKQKTRGCVSLGCEKGLDLSVHRARRGLSRTRPHVVV